MVKAAIALAGAEGIGSLTLRSVAHRTRRPVASIQRMFTSRDRLVAAMTQDVYPPGGKRPSDPARPAEQLMHLAQAEWAVYCAHPWLVTVLASTRPPLTPTVLDIAREYVEAFIALGTDPAVALGRYLALNAYVQGMALLLVAEQQERTRAPKSAQTWWSDEISRLNRTGAPSHAKWIAEVSTGKVPDSADIERWFQGGLTRIIAGLIDEDTHG